MRPHPKLGTRMRHRDGRSCPVSEMWVVLAAVALVVVAGATACSGGGGAARASDASTLAIGTVYPLAGAQGFQGTQESRGVQLAAEWANDHHVLGGRRIELVAEAADRAEAVPGVMEDLHRRGIDLVVGSHASAISQAAAAVATAQHQLFWETGAVGQTLPGTGGGSSFFRVAPMGSNLGSSAIDFIAHQVAPHLTADHRLRYAVAYVDDPYGREVADGAIAEIHALHEPDAGSFRYDASTVDYHQLARRIAAARPDVLYVSAYIADGIALRRALVDEHVPLLANIGTSSSYCMLQFGQPLGADAVGLFASDKPDADDVNPAALAPEGRTALAWVSKVYRQRYHEDMPAPALSGFSAAYALFVHVLPTAHGDSPSAIAKAALSVHLARGTLANGSGLSLAAPGSVDAGDNRAATSVIWEWVAPGKRVVVWPAAFATHALEVLPLAG
jgi:ABC-type branched-subunit amino acid transport system substrate-binding protein